MARKGRDYTVRYDWTPGPTYGQRRATTGAEKRALFAQALRNAWQKAKREKAARDAQRVLPSSGEIQGQIIALENKERIGAEGAERLNQLRRDLAEAHRREAEKKDLIASAAGRFCTVTFIKADGSERVMRVQPAMLRHHVKGETASEAARKAVTTRAAKHPHLFPVWDTEKGAPRSINLSTVTRIALDGAVHTYAN